MARASGWETDERLWLELAAGALGAWKLRALDLSWLGFSGKAVIKARTAAGDFVMRLYPAGRVNLAWLRSELRWLSSIRRHTELVAPLPIAPIAAGRESLIVELRHDRLPPPRRAYATLCEYIAGASKPASELSEEDVFRIGEYLGALHSEAQMDMGSDFARPHLDWEGLFGADSLYAAPGAPLPLQDDERAIMAAAAERLRQPLSLDSSPGDAGGLLHGDLLAKNVVFRPGAIAALDFEYCGWGRWLYDLAPLLWQLRGERSAEVAELEEALWRGYTSVRPLPEEERTELESLIAARQLASIRWLLANQQNPTIRDAAPALVAKRCDELKSFLETGVLRRSTPTL